MVAEGCTHVLPLTFGVTAPIVLIVIDVALEEDHRKVVPPPSMIGLLSKDTLQEGETEFLASEKSIHPTTSLPHAYPENVLPESSGP